MIDKDEQTHGLWRLLRVLEGRISGLRSREGTKLQRRRVSSAEPATSDVLAWNATTGQWEPTAASAPGSHIIATTAGLGASHTTSGLTAGQVLRATGATTAAFAVIQSGDLPASVVETTDADWIDLTDAGETALHSHAGSGTIHGESLHTGDIMPDAAHSFTGSMAIKSGGGIPLSIQSLLGVERLRARVIGSVAALELLGGSIVLVYSDQGSTIRGQWTGTGKMRLGDSVSPSEMLEVAGNSLITGTVRPQTGILLDEQATPAWPATDVGHLFSRANGSMIELVFKSSTGAEAILASLADTIVSAPPNVLTLAWIE